jgi:hypothetical protein
MKKLLGIVVLGLLLSSNAYAGLIYGKETLPIVTKPEGANCTFKNNKGNWNITTPDTIKFKLSKKKLKVTCKKEGYKTKERFIFVRAKDSVLSNMADHDIIGTDLETLVTDGIIGAITSNPLHALSSIIFTGIEAAAKVTGKVGNFIKEPVTYATHLIPNKKIYAQAKNFEIKKKLKEEGYVRFILIELEKE